MGGPNDHQGDQAHENRVDESEDRVHREASPALAAEAPAMRKNPVLLPSTTPSVIDLLARGPTARRVTAVRMSRLGHRLRGRRDLRHKYRDRELPCPLSVSFSTPCCHA